MAISSSKATSFSVTCALLRMKSVTLFSITTADTSPMRLASPWYHCRPLQPGRKLPFPGSRGCKDATTDAEMIKRWWAAAPSANIGIATGHVVDVIDIDGPDGIRAWLSLDAWPPILGSVNTPRLGGTHYYLAKTGRGNGAGRMPGIDYRGMGGYVLAPPSHLDEQPGQPYGGHYTWRQPLTLGEAGAH